MLSCHLKMELEKEEQIKPKVNRRKEIIKSKMDELENRKTIEKKK